MNCKKSRHIESIETINDTRKKFRNIEPDVFKMWTEYTQKTDLPTIKK